MQIHHMNFGPKTGVRCGFYVGKYNFPAHIHQFPEIVYCIEGEMELTVSGKTEQMRAGDMAVIAPFRVHSFRTPEYTKRWLAVFSPDFISNLVSEQELYGEGEKRVFRASDELRAFVDKHLYDSHETFFRLTAADIRSFKTMFFAVYEEYMNKIPIGDGKNSMSALSAILLYVSEHYKEKITLERIGAALGYSRKYVSLCLSDIDGMNLPNLVNSFRVDHAKSLLMETNLKIIDIAFECGFADEKSFYRAFERLTGVTPGAYKRSRRTATHQNEGAGDPGTSFQARNRSESK